MSAGGRVWRRLDNGVVIVSQPTATSTRQRHLAQLDGRTVGTFSAEPGGRGCGGRPRVRATVGGRGVEACSAVAEWVELLDLLPAPALLLRRPREKVGKADWLATHPPQTERYRERMRYWAPIVIAETLMLLQAADAAEHARRIALHDHPIAVALRVGDAAPDPAPAPPATVAPLALAERVAAASWLAYGTSAAIRDQLAELHPHAGTDDPVALVVSLLYLQAGSELPWQQTTLFDAAAA